MFSNISHYICGRCDREPLGTSRHGLNPTSPSVGRQPQRLPSLLLSPSAPVIAVDDEDGVCPLHSVKTAQWSRLFQSHVFLDSLKSALQTFLPESLSLHLMCEYCLSALLSPLLSFFSFESQLSHNHLSLPMSPWYLFILLFCAANHFHSCFLCYSVAIVCTFRSVGFSLHIPSLALVSGFSPQNVSVCSSAHLYHNHTLTVERTHP